MEQITSGKDEPGWESWPHPRELWKLSYKANGLFHYAGTALHWIKAQIDEHGRACQGWVLDNLTQEGGLGQLEDLYRAILTSFEKIDHPARNKQRREARLAGFQHVIGTILVLHKPFTIRQIVALLDDIQVEDLDVAYFLRQMRSVLVPGMTTSFEDTTPQMHKSFRDYIMDGHAPAEFRILSGHAHFVTARSCLEVIVKAGNQADVVVEYSVQHWYKHFRKAVEGGVTCEDERMWNLFGEMLEQAVIGIWVRTPLKDLFVDVATAGWGLLKQQANKDKMQGISNILKKVKLTFSHLLVSSLCVLFPHCPYLSCSLFLAFSSLGSACFSPITPPYTKIWNEGLLETWDSC
ncbi:hypothetical protein B0H13DRAFT_1643571 [Mycena leptocephala]|nr:hypothetical protein B0H13DRAFT_1643571 [Mycena leptocephala]